MDEELVGSQPFEGISNVLFHPVENDILLSSSWDSMLRLYNTSSKSLIKSYKVSSPILCSIFDKNSNSIISGGIENDIESANIENGEIIKIGNHESGVSCLANNEKDQTFFSGSWDTSVKQWDIRSFNKEVCSVALPQPEKVYAISCADLYLIVATAERLINIFDTRNLSAPIHWKQSPLKSQTRCVSSFPNGKGYAITSVEGRVGIEYIDMDEKSQSQKYAFKCHRTKEKGVDISHPINAVEFHPINGLGTFVTGGADGTAIVWDGNIKKKKETLPSKGRLSYPYGISSMSFNKDGSKLAIASSYTYEHGDRNDTLDSIFIHNF